MLATIITLVLLQNYKQNPTLSNAINADQLPCSKIWPLGYR